MNRAIARRPIFEDRKDVRYFLAGIARAVRRGQLEVHSWCVMATHYHLLVRSPVGELADAMRRIQNVYTRYFNRARRRDGPLFRGRYVSRHIDSHAYRRAVLGYIDANPVQASICAQPWDYPWGSARQYVTKNGPKWLCRDWVEELVAESSPARIFDPREYPRSGDPRQRASVERLVDSRLQKDRPDNELDSLLGMAGPEVRIWLRRKSKRADGESKSAPFVDVEAVGDAIEESRSRLGEWTVRPLRRAVDAWSILHAGLLRHLASSSLTEVAKRLAVGVTHAHRLLTRHGELMDGDEEYASRAEQMTCRLLEVYGRLFGNGRGARVVVGEEGENGPGTVRSVQAPCLRQIDVEADAALADRVGDVVGDGGAVGVALDDDAVAGGCAGDAEQVGLE